MTCLFQNIQQIIWNPFQATWNLLVTSFHGHFYIPCLNLPHYDLNDCTLFCNTPVYKSHHVQNSEILRLHFYYIGYFFESSWNVQKSLRYNESTNWSSQ